MTGRLTLDTADGPILARAAATADRAVVLLKEALGANAHIRDVARRFADCGFLAIAPDLFHRTGIAELPDDRHADADADGLTGTIDVTRIATDAPAWLACLHGQEIAVDRTAVVGFRLGGRVAFPAATAVPSLGAAVVFSRPSIAAGPHAMLERAAAITAPLPPHVGADDPTIPPAQVTAIDVALVAAGVRFIQRVCPGAGHAFARDARSHPLRAEPACARTLARLDEHLPERA